MVNILNTNWYTNSKRLRVSQVKENWEIEPDYLADIEEIEDAPEQSELKPSIPVAVGEPFAGTKAVALYITGRAVPKTRKAMQALIEDFKLNFGIDFTPQGKGRQSWVAGVYSPVNAHYYESILSAIRKCTKQNVVRFKEEGGVVSAFIAPDQESFDSVFKSVFDQSDQSDQPKSPETLPNQPAKYAEFNMTSYFTGREDGPNIIGELMSNFHIKFKKVENDTGVYYTGMFSYPFLTDDVITRYENLRYYINGLQNRFTSKIFEGENVVSVYLAEDEKQLEQLFGDMTQMYGKGEDKPQENIAPPHHTNRPYDADIEDSMNIEFYMSMSTRTLRNQMRMPENWVEILSSKYDLKFEKRGIGGGRNIYYHAVLPNVSQETSHQIMVEMKELGQLLSVHIMDTDHSTMAIYIAKSDAGFKTMYAAIQGEMEELNRVKMNS